MASGTQVVHGAYVGTGALLTIETKIGFKPSRVELLNVSADEAQGIWTEMMADDSVFKQKAGATALATSGGVIPTASGFSIGTDADLNVVGEQVLYTAWR